MRARARRLVVLLAVLCTTVTACTTTVPGTPRAAAGDRVTVSYANAAEALAGLDPTEADEQVRDWARLALARALDLDLDRVVDALYDSTPLRDPALDGLVDLPDGPGRALFDGTTLHLLVPADGPRAALAVAALLDQHRTDSGADPERVQVHRYTVRRDAAAVDLVADPPSTAAEARAAHGWTERRVDDAAGLAAFVGTVDHLSRLEARGREIWAGGWDRPDVAPAVTAEDVAVLQRGYLQRSGPLPGFSLDPGPVTTADDVQAVLPDLAPELAGRVLARDLAGTPFGSVEGLLEVVDGTILRGDPPADTLPQRGLPADRAQLWALRNLLLGADSYSRARYDGGLAGTEVGMTLFYTDYVAKDWVTGAGTGVPTDAVPGFVPATLARTPPGLCPGAGSPRDVSGRLWFGQDDGAFRYSPGAVDVGARSTRLFFLQGGAGGAEVEAEYRIGRPLRWFDRHYGAVADHEPQYRRLEELMRWSGALEWLTLDGTRSLPQPPDTAIRSNLVFADWYAAHTELRERGPLRVVRPPSAGQEAVLPVPSPTFEDCAGLLEITGGVSLADRLSVRGGQPAESAPLPPGMQRARPADAATTRVDAGGAGRVSRPAASGERTYDVARGPGAAASTVTGPPSVAVRTGEVRLRAEDGPRRATTAFRGQDRTTRVDVSVGDAPLGGVEFSVQGETVTVSLRPGFGELLRNAARWFERFRAALGRVPTGAPFRYGEALADGQVVARVDDGAAGGWVRWGDPAAADFRASVVTESTAPDGTVQRLGLGAPTQLSAVDRASFTPVGRPARTTWGEAAALLPSTTSAFRAVAPGGEIPAPVAGLPVDAAVTVVAARPRTDLREQGLPDGTYVLLPAGADAPGTGPGGSGERSVPRAPAPPAGAAGSDPSAQPAPPGGPGGVLLDATTLDALGSGSLILLVRSCEGDQRDPECDR